MIIKKSAFTLIEMVVSITIFSIIMISVMTIYIISSDISIKADINRVMQENIKSVVEHISEDVRKNKIEWVTHSLALEPCDFDPDSWKYKVWSTLCTSDWTYYLANELWNWQNDSYCEEFINHCVIYKLWSGPITNSYVSIKELQFSVSNESIPKVTINMIVQPAIWKWIKSKLIKNNELIFQTTITDRVIEQ